MAPERQERGRALIRRVREELIAQGGPSLGGERNGTCLYRAPDGRRCAAGLLMSDEFYRPELETKTVDDARVWDALLASGVDPDLRGLVESLQRVHDGYVPSEDGPWDAYVARRCRVLEEESF